VIVEARPSRRVVLAASAATIPLLISACRGAQVLGTPPPPAPDVRQLRTAIGAERALIAAYRAAAPHVSAGTSVSAALAALVAEHEQHLTQLTSRLIVPAGSADSAPVKAATPVSIPAGVPSALSALAEAEQAAAQRLATQLLEMPASLAQLLASISASEATHVPVLDALRRSA
jgi:rubrerythrin